MICVSVAHMSGLDEAIHSGAGLIELRLDLIRESPSKLFPLLPKAIETIVTCRPGVYADSERVELLKAGMKLGASYVDIEIEEIQPGPDNLGQALGIIGNLVQTGAKIAVPIP